MTLPQSGAGYKKNTEKTILSKISSRLYTIKNYTVKIIFNHLLIIQLLQLLENYLKRDIKIFVQK